MEHSNENAEILENLMCPAFAVADGIITHANQAALQRGIQLNTNVTDWIAIGTEEYQQFSEGKLCITLRIQDITYYTTVTTSGKNHIFCLASDYEDPELRAFALAAQQLRGPLASAMVSTEQLLPNSAAWKEQEDKQNLAQLSRSLHQLLRAVSNMSDAAHYANRQAGRMQTCDLTAIFEETLEKAALLVSQAGCTFNFTLPKQSVCGLADAEKLERAVLNLISNAMKYTPSGGIITATLRHSKGKLIFTIQDSGPGIDPQVRSNVFSRFLREPGLDDGRSGIGLGMTIVRSVAAIHGGTVLMEQPENQGARFTMTLAVNQDAGNVVRTPILLPVDYAGGRDHSLLELSDVLPASLYDNID